MSDSRATEPLTLPSPDLRASVASWLGALFLLVLLLIAAGGVVRLTQSGLSLPGWPMVDGRLLPPFTEAGWQAMYQLYLADMAEMRQLRASGEAVGLGALGHMPNDLADFQRIFLIEWSHRALALLVGVVGFGCLAVLLRKRELRRLAGGPLKAIAALIVLQSVIGGILVHSYTATHWLFIHLGMATVILGLILWCLLLLLRGHRQPIADDQHARRSRARKLVTWALVIVWVQIMLGALVAGSRHNGFSSTWPDMNGELVPTLWNSSQVVAWNLLDNPYLHQWIHRWFAWIVVVLVCAAVSWGLAARPGARGRIALRLTLVLLGLQILLGLVNVFQVAALPVALGHLLIGMLLFCALVLARFDIAYEADSSPVPASGERSPSAVARPRGWRQLVRDLMVLTKFRINVVGVFTGFAAIVLYASLTPAVEIGAASVAACLGGLLLMGGAANTLNQIIERDKDARMERTRERRPLPSGRIGLGEAWAIAMLQLFACLSIFTLVFGSALAVGLVLFTVLYYAVFYTMYLKPRHYLNIVIGGVPGAMGPVIAWAAFAGNLAWEPLALFAIIFLWTPPHVWALAIKLREDYRAAGIPMLPVVKGVDETTRQIFWYTVIMVAGTLALPALLPAFEAVSFYTVTAVIGGGVFLVWAWRIWRHRPIGNTMPLFHYSILYIGLLFTAVIADAMRLGGGGLG